jgi:hypothetical protein
MPDDKPNESTTDTKREPVQQEFEFTGMTNDEAGSQKPIVATKKDVAPSQEDTKKSPTKFMADPPKDETAVGQLKELWNVKSMDPHLEEMLKDAKAKKTPKGLMIQLDKEGHEIFAGKIGSQDVIGVPSGHQVDPKTAETMVAMAKQKGWDKVYCTLTSTQKEKDNLWIECQRQGLKMGNYTPDKDSDIVKKWEDEKIHGRTDIKLTNVAPEDSHTDTLKLLKSTAEATDNPALKAGWTAMADKLAQGNLHLDDQKAKAIAGVIKDHPDANGFNAIAASLNQADPTLKIAPVDPGAGTGGQPAVKVSRANTASANAP